MGETGAEHGDAMTERLRKRLQKASLLYTDLDGCHLAADRQIHQAFLYAPVHVFDQADRFVQGIVILEAGSGPEPFPVFLDIEVEAPAGKARGPAAEIRPDIDRQHADGRGVRAEGYGNAGRFQHQLQLFFVEAVEPGRVEAVIGIRRIGKDLAGKGQLRRLDIVVILRK